MINNQIEISYCSKYIATLLKQKGFAVECDEISHDIAIKWLLINFNLHVWPDYDNRLKHWCGNYMILDQVSNWFSGYESPDAAIEAVLECVLENLIPDLEISEK
jgi:hypothetical protein